MLQQSDFYIVALALHLTGRQLLCLRSHQKLVDMDPCLKTLKPKLLLHYCLFLGPGVPSGLVRDWEVHRPGHEASILGGQEGMWSWGWWGAQKGWSSLDNRP